jgi:pimeloyl-ACP methyl ester carboxylesterase
MNSLELNIPGFSIAYRTWGHPENQPIIALHGWLDNANSFEPIAECLEEHYYFVAIDLPGHGLSSHLPAGAHYHFIDGLFSVVHIIEALNFNKVHLLGHSLGACIASLVAGIAPQHLLSLSLIEGLGPITQPAESSPIQLAHYLNHLTSLKQNTRKSYQDIDSAAQARAVKEYVSLDSAKRLCQRGLVAHNGVYYWRHDQRLAGPSPLQLTEQQVLSCLEQIPTKTFLLWASNGFSFNQRLMELRVNAVQNLTVEYLEGGHHIHMEQPKAVAELLAVFFRTL